MKINHQKKRLLLFLLGVSIQLSAQISIGGNPYSWEYPTVGKKETQQVKFPIPVKSELEAEDKQDEINGLPPRFGYLNQTNINLLSDKNKVVSNKETIVWQLAIHCPTALSINFLFDKFWLPTGGKLFIYSADKQYLIGAFTTLNNKGTISELRGFGTGLVYGDNVILEYEEPTKALESAVINVSAVIHGYRHINVPSRFNKTDNFGTSGSCQVNVNCPEGTNWQNEKRGVALILVGGNRNCTGSLINNTANNGDLLFLTANHCLAGRNATTNPNATDWSFWWDYESPNCANPQNDPNNRVTNGATILANSANSDFALLRLTESPLAATPPINIYYNGWDRTNNIPQSGVCIHHPRGDIKKISTFTAPLTSTTWGSPVAQVWNVNWVQTATNIGVTEPTSSGSPLFQANRLIVGQLFGGPSACGIAANFRNDNYGRVNSSWAGEGANTNRLSNWLDPNNSGANTLAGGFWDGCLQNITVSNPINTFADIQAANSITANSIIANGATVNMRTGNFIEFTNGFDSRTGSTLTAQIAPCGGRVIPPANKQENEEIAKNSINSNSNAIHVYPNPSAGKLNIDFALTESDQVSFSVTNLLGEVVLSWNKNYSVGGNISEQTTLENLASGVYLVNVSNKKINFNQKIVVQ